MSSYEKIQLLALEWLGYLLLAAMFAAYLAPTNWRWADFIFYPAFICYTACAGVVKLHFYPDTKWPVFWPFVIRRRRGTT